MYLKLQSSGIKGEKRTENGICCNWNWKKALLFPPGAYQLTKCCKIWNWTFSYSAVMFNIKTLHLLLVLYFVWRCNYNKIKWIIITFYGTLWYITYSYYYVFTHYLKCFQKRQNYKIWPITKSPTLGKYSIHK